MCYRSIYIKGDCFLSQSNALGLHVGCVELYQCKINGVNTTGIRYILFESNDNDFVYQHPVHIHIIEMVLVK